MLAELLDYFSGRGSHLRQMAWTMVARLRDDPNTEIVPATSIGFREALDLYRERPDKEWSLTDCSSICIMRQAGITEALAHDNHFTQAGLEVLLR